MTRLFLAALLSSVPIAAQAQVIEIDSTGEIRTYDGPTVFVATDATPIRWRRSSATSPKDAHSRLVAEARNHGLDQGLLEAVAWQESRGRMSAVSVKGALGVMQLMPSTAAELGVDPGDLTDNIRGGALYLRRQLDRFGGSVPLALAAYNAGPGAVLRHRGIPPYRETRNYVARIMHRWRPAMVATKPVSILSIEVSQP